MSTTEAKEKNPSREKPPRKSTTPTLGFTVLDRDREALDALVARFGDGNRSEFLRQAIHVMTSIMIAEDLQEFQAYGTKQAEAAGVTDIQDVIAWQKANRKNRRGL
ncbi:hypothetical protein DPM19_13665 [Actinomadura craniellae]|uniref:Uncharacterized protein n=1 Tax=Actinomadura craniellae TaxID=2231787 RepID=A0A365H707_9ACTN|nr:hypothetical protein [Actinomadura craniellae]RAY14782.1 hypothetical protein DPM19_13665 [Actinomadura craniellae]